MPPKAKSTVSQGANVLQDRLHDLLSKIAGTIEDVKDWPENVDSAAHYKTTTKIIDRIQEIIRSLQRVEDHVQKDSSLRESLQRCLIPMDLLELLDHSGSETKQDKGFGLNPECYASGLLREATGQLAGLKRRKNALEMLGTAIERGLNARNQQSVALAEAEASLKRDRDQAEGATQEVPRKRAKVNNA